MIDSSLKIRSATETALQQPKSTGEKDAIIAYRGTLHGLDVVAVAFEFNFHGGSMGYAVGEKFTRAAGVALENGIPLICLRPLAVLVCRKLLSR